MNATKRTDIFLIDPRNIVVMDDFNCRREFDLDELKEQIKAKGVLNPLTVIPYKDGHAVISHDAIVNDRSSYVVLPIWWASGRYTTWTRSNNMWCVYDFYDTGQELIKKAYNDSEKSGREYERLVKYVDEILKEAEK